MDALKNLRELASQNNIDPKITEEENNTNTTAPRAKQVDVEEIRKVLSGPAEYLKALAERDDNYTFFKEIERLGENIWEMFYPDC